MYQRNENNQVPHLYLNWLILFPFNGNIIPLRVGGAILFTSQRNLRSLFCSFRGKKVRDDHLINLVPEKLNGVDRNCLNPTQALELSHCSTISTNGLPLRGGD